jgi:hypothetical protein
MEPLEQSEPLSDLLRGMQELLEKIHGSYDNSVDEIGVMLYRIEQYRWHRVRGTHDPN